MRRDGIQKKKKFMTVKFLFMLERHILSRTVEMGAATNEG